MASRSQSVAGIKAQNVADLQNAFVLGGQFRELPGFFVQSVSGFSTNTSLPASRNSLHSGKWLCAGRDHDHAHPPLHLPSLAFIGEGSERGVGGVFSLFRPHGLRWLEPTEASAVACGYGGRVAGVEIDCAYVSHVIITRLENMRADRSRTREPHCLPYE
jgi:hypothetical protein